MVEQQITDSARQNPLVWTFMGELDTQCANAELAYTAFVLALSERDASGSQGRAQQRKVFFYVHAFLSHAAYGGDHALATAGAARQRRRA